jgi:hypothetical protein
VVVAVAVAEVGEVRVAEVAEVGLECANELVEVDLAELGVIVLMNVSVLTGIVVVTRPWTGIHHQR